MSPTFRQAILIVLALTGLLLAQGPGSRGRGMGSGPCGDPFLSPERRTELHELVSGLRDDGAAREEIRTAVTDLFASWGIDPPEFRLGPGRRGPAPWADQLTEERRAVLHELVSGLRADGATREDIHTAVVTQLAEWGIDWSFDCPGQGHRGDRAGRVSRIQARNYPNPFNPNTQIAYTLEEPAVVEVAIYNLTGRLMRSYRQGSQSAGSYSVYWNGRTADGQPAPSGVYFYRIQAGNEVLTDRMLLMK